MKKQLLNRKKLTQLFFSLCLMLFCTNVSWGQGVTKTTPGTYTYTVPAGVTSIILEAWGGGGAGGSAKNNVSGRDARGGGGAGGSYATTTLSVTTGQVITYTVGAGGTAPVSGFTNGDSGAGGLSSASIGGNDVIKALGGPGGASALVATINVNGAGGTAATTGNTGTSFVWGGNGGTAANGGTGGGGGSAGNALNGNNGSGGSSGFAGGSAVTGGGAGGAGSNTNNTAVAGSAGSIPGGGGGGASSRGTATSYAAGGNGGAGKVVISYPIISNTGSFSSLSTVAGVASGSTSIGVTGADMQSAITATASDGFEVSSNNSTFSSSITSNATSGSISFPTVYVRLAASATEGTYDSGTVTFTGTNAATVTVTIPSSTVSSASVAGVTVSTTSLSTSFAKTTAGANSTASQSFTVSGVNLGTDAITIAAPTHFKISLTDVDANYSSSNIVLTPSSGTVSTTPIYVKYSPTGTGNISGNSASISITNTSVDPQTVSVTGSGLNAFYYNSGSLATLGSWKALSDGSGDSPSDFTTAGITYTILTNATTDASWTVSGTGSKVIVGNGSAVALTVADTFPITGTIDAAANGSIYWKHVSDSPTFGILHSNSEVHLQPTTPAIGLTSVSYAIPGTSFGKLFIDGAAPINLSNGHTVNTLLSVAEGSQLILPTQTSHYIYINTGASAIINGTVRSIKKTGVFSFNISTPNGNTGIQFKDSGSTLALSATSTIDYSSINGTQTISALPSGSSYANLTLSENSTNITSSSIKAFPTLTITGTLTINTPGNPSWPSSTTGAGSITLGNGATIVRTIGALNAAPIFDSSVNVNYNGNGATQMVGDTTSSSPNVTLTTSNAAIVVGNTVTGIGVPEGTTVASISGTALVLSQNATATANNVTFTIGTAVPQTTGFELPTVTSVLNNLTINNPAGVTLGGNVSVNGNLALTAGKLAIGVNTLTLNGSYSGSAANSLVGSSTSNLTTTGTTGTLFFDQTTTGTTNVLKNLTLSSGTATLGNVLNITAGASSGIVTVGSGATLTTGGFLTLKSDATGTASVGNSAGTISGNVTVERYIPAKRAWRALTSPVSTTGSIFANWQEGGTGNLVNGFDIWMPAGTNGVTAGGTSNSLLSYTSSGNSWAGVTNTSDPSTMIINGKNKPFMAFVTGPYGSNNVTSGATATTIRATGSLFTGNQTYSSGAGEYTFIGNPYASPLNLKVMLDDSDNNAFDNTIWIWQAIGSGNVGVYNSYDPTGTGTYTNVTNPNGIDATTQIQSGQAFFVKSTAADTFTIKESHKGTTNSAANIVFRDAAPAQLLRVGLYKQENNEWSGRDGAMTVILQDANANQSPNKMANGTENVAFVKNGSLFASEHHLPLVANDVLNIRVWRTTAGANYKLKINTEQFTSTNLNATLEDLFTNSRTPLNLEGTAVEYPFTVTNDALSTGDRFRIVFQNAFLGTNNPTATSFSIVPNPVTGDSFQVNLGTLATGIYSYSICNAIGQEVEKGILNKATQNTNYEVKMSNSATGIYIMKIKGNDNTVFTAKIIKK
jgi:hypothetical protein